jgi:hypothetical protein
MAELVARFLAASETIIFNRISLFICLDIQLSAILLGR